MGPYTCGEHLDVQELGLWVQRERHTDTHTQRKIRHSQGAGSRMKSSICVHARARTHTHNMTGGKRKRRHAHRTRCTTGRRTPTDRDRGHGKTKITNCKHRTPPPQQGGAASHVTRVHTQLRWRRQRTPPASHTLTYTHKYTHTRTHRPCGVRERCTPHHTVAHPQNCHTHHKHRRQYIKYRIHVYIHKSMRMLVTPSA